MTMATPFRWSVASIRIRPSSPTHPIRSLMARRCMSCRVRATESRSRDSEPTAICDIEACRAGHARAPGERLQGRPELPHAERGDGALLQGAGGYDASTKRAWRGLEARATGRRQDPRQVVGVV